MKLASFSRVSHLVSERDQLIAMLDADPRITFESGFWTSIVDADMISLLLPVIKPAIEQEIRRRIGVIDAELSELGMSID